MTEEEKMRPGLGCLLLLGAAFVFWSGIALTGWGLWSALKALP